MFSSNTSAVSGDAVFVEDIFSTTLYTGNSSTQTITNGIDLAGKGGLVWRQGRSAATGGMLIDTARGIGSYLISYSTDAAQTGSNWIDSFNSNGFTMNSSSFNGGATYASWTFRKQPKFFDVVTYTGNGTNGRTVAHSLGSTPGCIIVKRTDAANGWAVYHRAMNASPQDYMMRLNATDGAFTTTPSRWNNTLPTSTEFTLSGNDEVNGSGATYVAYLFAHNAGGFGLTGTDNVISCGSFTTDGSGLATINLGYEAQWVLIKNSGAVGDWEIYDTIRGMSYSSAYWLRANLSSAEANVGSNTVFPTATGFSYNGFAASQTGIYIAIRRGPMKVPTSGTSVFSPAIRTGTGSSVSLTSAGFPPDLYLPRRRNTTSGSNYWWDRLRGASVYVASDNTNAEVSGTRLTSFNQTGVTLGSLDPNASGSSYVDWYFGRAPSFFDEVCYTGTGSATTFSHNLGVAPELMIVKKRSGVEDWAVYPNSATDYLLLNATQGIGSASTVWNNTAPTSSVFSVGTSSLVNTSAATYVAYLFATCAGVSKCFSYTGNGSSQTINCGFTGGARWILIKRTDSTGDWYVWDSARGIVSGNDPHLSLNTTAAEVTTDDTIDTDSTGFVVNQVSATNVNVSSATYIGIAIA